MNNGTAVTGSMSATLTGRPPVGDLRIARDDAANYFGGTYDKLDLYSTVKANHNDRLIRNPAPRAAHCLASYDFDKSAAALVYDRSRYENHLICVNTPTETASLSHNPAPIRALSQSVDAGTKRKQMLVAVGGSYYIVDLD
jgi:hypothetical protein